MLVELAAAVVTMIFRDLVDKYLTTAPIGRSFSGPQAAGLVALSGTLLYVYRRLKSRQRFKISFSPAKNTKCACRSRNESFFYPNTNARGELMRTTNECLRLVENGSASNLSWKSASSIRLPEKIKNESLEERNFKLSAASSVVSVKSSFGESALKMENFSRGDCRRNRRLISRNQETNRITRRTRSGRVYSLYV